jgi:hypothetical protein
VCPFLAPISRMRTPFIMHEMIGDRLQSPQLVTWDEAAVGTQGS